MSDKKMLVTTYTFPEAEIQKWLEKNGDEAPKTIGLRECTLEIETLAVQEAIESETAPAMEMIKMCVVQLDGEACEINGVEAFFDKAPKSMRDLVREAWSKEATYSKEDEESFFASKTKSF